MHIFCPKGIRQLTAIRKMNRLHAILSVSIKDGNDGLREVKGHKKTSIYLSIHLALVSMHTGLKFS